MPVKRKSLDVAEWAIKQFDRLKPHSVFPGRNGDGAERESPIIVPPAGRGHLAAQSLVTDPDLKRAAAERLPVQPPAPRPRQGRAC